MIRFTNPRGSLLIGLGVRFYEYARHAVGEYVCDEHEFENDPSLHHLGLEREASSYEIGGFGLPKGTQVHVRRRPSGAYVREFRLPSNAGTTPVEWRELGQLYVSSIDSSRVGRRKPWRPEVLANLAVVFGRLRLQPTTVYVRCRNGAHHRISLTSSGALVLHDHPWTQEEKNLRTLEALAQQPCRCVRVLQYWRKWPDHGGYGMPPALARARRWLVALRQKKRQSLGGLKCCQLPAGSDKMLQPGTYNLEVPGTL